MARSKIGWIALALSLVVALTMRLWNVTAEPLWLDEAYSAYAAAHDFGFIRDVVPRYEAHPPFYYTLLKLWTLLFGDSLAALRGLGIAAALATLPIVWLGGRDLGQLLGLGKDSARIAVVAFAIAAVSLPLVEMARQVRPYPLMILVYAAGTLAVLRLYRRLEVGRALAGADYAAYLFLVEAMLWLHDLGALFAAALGSALLLVIARKAMRRVDLIWFVAGHALVLALYLPALLMLLDQAPTWVGSTWLRFSFTSLPEKIATIYAVPGWQGLSAVVLILLGIAAMRRHRRLCAVMLIVALVPVGAAILLSMMITPVFLPRVLSPVAVPALLLCAVGACAFSGRLKLIGLGAAFILVVNMLAVDIQARAAGPMQDWYRTVDWLARHIRPGDRIFAYPNEGALPLSYALRDRGLSYPIYAVPTDVPSFDPTGWHPTGYRAVVSLPRWRLREIAGSPATRAVPTIWLLRLGPNAYDVGDVALEEFGRGRRPMRRWVDGPIDIVALSRRDLSLPEPARNPR